MHTLGNGILTSNVTSSCSGNNVSSLITQNSSLSLVATPISGYTFLKWGGDCSNSASSTCLINMNAAKNVTAVFSSNADLCNGLITDKLAHPMTPFSKPSLGSTVTDPQFGTTIREPHVVISPTGTRLLFASNWAGGSNAYVVELPSYAP